MIPLRSDCFRAHSEYGKKPDISTAFCVLLKLPNEFRRFDTMPPDVTPTTIPSVGDNFDEQEQCRVVLPFTACLPPVDERSLIMIRTPFLTVSKHIARHVEAVWTNKGNLGSKYEKKINEFGVSRE